MMNSAVYIFDLASTGREHCSYIVKTLVKNHASWLDFCAAKRLVRDIVFEGKAAKSNIYTAVFIEQQKLGF
ncbi:MAG: hypothetical protein K0R21_693 [Anaerocolumna sp.]|nr:hypothetical protein [Anaerocolumna sp.]